MCFLHSVKLRRGDFATGQDVSRPLLSQDVISVVPGQLVLHSCHFEADLKSPFISAFT